MSTDARIELLLAIADDELIIGHRMSEWTGWVPYVEEDIAVSSIAQDEMAHARALYEIAVTMGAAADVDALALGRTPEQYRNAVLCERPNRDYAYTLARHYLYDTADAVRVAALQQSSWKELAGVMRMIAMEEQFHLRHARTWFQRVAAGPVEARAHLTAALRDTVAEALSIFEPLPSEAVLVEDGTMPRSSAQMLTEWLDELGPAFEAVGLEQVLESTADAPVGEMVPTSSGSISQDPSSQVATQTLRVPALQREDGRWVHIGEFEGAGGRLGHHSPDFEPLWTEMTALYREHPGASW